MCDLSMEAVMDLISADKDYYLPHPNGNFRRVTDESLQSIKPTSAKLVVFLLYRPSEVEGELKWVGQGGHGEHVNDAVVTYSKDAVGILGFVVS